MSRQRHYQDCSTCTPSIGHTFSPGCVLYLGAQSTRSEPRLPPPWRSGAGDRPVSGDYTLMGEIEVALVAVPGSFRYQLGDGSTVSMSDQIDGIVVYRTWELDGRRGRLVLRSDGTSRFVAEGVAYELEDLHPLQHLVAELSVAQVEGIADRLVRYCPWSPLAETAP